jgi:hypothetical protein
MKFLQLLMSSFMSLNVPLSTWFGVPVILHWSCVIIFLVLLFLNLFMAPSFIGLFFIVLLHEFGHCFAGKYYS